MTIILEPTGAALGAVVRGVNLAGCVDDRVFSNILEAFARHHVLVFPEQCFEVDLGSRIGVGRSDDKPDSW